jgi:hypothetical protein
VAGHDTCTSILNCLFYPLFVPFTRSKARQECDIEGDLCEDLLAGWCWYVYIHIYICKKYLNLLNIIFNSPCCTTIQVKREYDFD